MNQINFLNNPIKFFKLANITNKKKNYYMKNNNNEPS